jgi:hypothetical protein
MTLKRDNGWQAVINCLPLFFGVPTDWGAVNFFLISLSYPKEFVRIFMLRRHENV